MHDSSCHTLVMQFVLAAIDLQHALSFLECALAKQAVVRVINCLGVEVVVGDVSTAHDIASKDFRHDCCKRIVWEYFGNCLGRWNCLRASKLY